MSRLMRAIGLVVLIFAWTPTAAAPERVEFSEAVLSIQVHLDRNGFRPGVIDGKFGRKTKEALDACLAVRGRAATVPDAPALRDYTVIDGDLDGLAPTPPSWPGKSKAKSLPHETALERLAERFHASQGLMVRLNPSVDFARLRAGQTLRVPNVADPRLRPVAKLEIHLADRLIRAFNNDGQLVLQLPCSVAKEKEKLPDTGKMKVTVVVKDPTFRFDPEVFKEVRGVDRELIIPPGPNNPVGTRWIGLSKRGYGIHGTPEPEKVSVTGSHGCFRLANWDAELLADVVLDETLVEIRP